MLSTHYSLSFYPIESTWDSSLKEESSGCQVKDDDAHTSINPSKNTPTMCTYIKQIILYIELEGHDFRW